PATPYQQVQLVLSLATEILHRADRKLHGLLGVVRQSDGGLERRMAFDGQIPYVAGIGNPLDASDVPERIRAALVLDRHRTAALSLVLAPVVEIQVVGPSPALKFTPIDAAVLSRGIVGVGVRAIADGLPEQA